MGKDKRGVNRGTCTRCNRCAEYESDLRPGSSHECSYCGCRPIHHVKLTSSTKRDQGYGRSDCYGIPPTFKQHRERIQSTEWNYHEAHISDIIHQRAMHMGHHAHGRSAASSSSQQFHGPFPHVQSREHCFDQYQSHGRYLPQQSQDWHMGRPPPKVYQQFSQRRQEYHDHPVTPHQQLYGDGLKNAEQYCHPRQHDAHGSCNLQRSRPATSLPQELPNRTEGTELHNFQGEPYGSHHLQRGNNNSLPTGKVSQMMGDVEKSCQQVKNGGEKVQQLQKKLKKLEEDQNFVKRELDYILRMQIPTAMDSSIQVHATQQTLVGFKYTTERVHFLQQQLKKLAEEQMSVNMEVQRIISMEMLGNQTQRITLTEELPSKGNFDVQSQSSSDQRITGRSIEIEKNVIQPKSESPQKQNPKDLHVGQKAPTSQQATADQRQVKNKPRRHQQTSAEDDNADTDRDDRSGKEGENLIKPDLEPPRQAANGESRETLAGQQRDGKTGAKTLEPSTQPVSTPGDESSEDDRNGRLGKEMKTLIKPEVETSLKQSSLGQDREALEGQEQCHDLMEGLKASCGIESSQPVTTTENDNSDADADRDGRPDTCKDVKDQLNPELQSPPWQSPVSQSEVESAPGTLTEHDPRVEPKPLQGTKQLQSTHVKTTDEAGNTDGDRDDRSGEEGENLSVIKPDLEPLLSGETVVQEGTCVISDINTASSETKPSQETASWERRNLGRLSFTGSPGGSVPSESEHHSMLEKDSASYVSQDPRLHLSVSVGDSEMSSGEYFSASSSEMVGLVPHMIDGQGATHKDWGTSHGPAFSACTSKTSQQQESSAFCSEISTGQEISDEQDTAVSNSAMSREHDELDPIEETSRSTRQSAHISNVHVSAGQNTPVTTLDIQIHMPIGQNAPVSSGDRLGEENVSVPHDKPITGQNAPASSNTLDLRDVHSIAQNPSVASDETSREQSVPSHGIPTGHNVAVSSPDMSRGQNVPGSTDTTVKKQTAQVSSSVTPRGLHLPVFSLDTCGNPTVSDPNHKMPCELDLSEEEKREAALPSNVDKSKEDVVASTMEKSAISPEEREQKTTLTKSKKEVMGTSPDKCKEIGVRLCPDQEYSTLNPTLLGEKEGKYDTVEQQASKLRQPRLKWMDQYHIFHPRVHGKNIQVESNGMTARRNHCYSDGICFSQSKVKVGCKVHLKIIESKEFKGSMRFGFTSNDPDKINVESLPAHSYPYLPQTQKGFWIKPLHDTLAQQGNVITYMVDSSGDVFYSINGEDKGLFFSGVDVSGTLWATADLHGSTIAVQFVDENAVCDRVQRTIHVGDQVKLQVDIQTLKLLQEGHGGIGDMEMCIGQTGVVMRIDDDEDVRVIFYKFKKLWCINPAAVQKVGKTDTSIIKEGDLVMIRTDRERFKELQLDLDEWDDDMQMTIGSIGRVRKVNSQGSLSVSVGGRTRKYHAECLKKIKLEQSSSSGVCEKGLHYWKQDGAKVCTRCEECTDKGADCSLTGHPLRPPGSACGCKNKRSGCIDCGLCQTCAGESDDDNGAKDTRKEREHGKDLERLVHEFRKKHGGEEDDDTGFGMTKGDKVKVDTDAATFRMLQEEGKIGWNEDMLQIIGIEGTVTGFRTRGVIVQFPNGARWTLIPGCLTKTAPGQQEARACFQKGDLVKVINDERKVKELQQGHGGYKHDMQATLGKTGRVLKVKKKQVSVEVNNKSWWFNPAVLIPTEQDGAQIVVPCHVKVGDHVKVAVDAETLSANQAGHGGFVYKMNKLLGKVGVVHHIDIDGDAVVYYPDGTRWCINAMSLGKVAPEECASVDVSAVLEVGDWVKVESDKRKIKHVQGRTVTWDTGYYDAAGKVGQVTTTYPFNVLVRVGIKHKNYPLSLSLVTKATAEDVKEAYGPGNVDNPDVARGDLVKVGVDMDKLRMMQNGHGGFVDEMEEVAGSIGSVSYIDKDGDIYVRFSLRRLCFNPHALSRVWPVEDTFYVGDIVLIESDQSRFKSLQTDEHGGYNSKMALTCGETGRILSIINHTRMKVKVLGKIWVFNPELLTRLGNPGVGTGDWKSATICASGKHDWSEGRCLVCITCGECTHYGNLCPARDKPGRFPGSLCGCGNGHAGCDDCGNCKRCAGELHVHVRDDTDEDDIRQRLLEKAGGRGEVAEALLQALMGKSSRGAADNTKPPDKEQLHRSRGEVVATPMQEMSGVLMNMKQAIELMRKSKGLDSIAAVTKTLQTDCVEPFSKYVSAADRRVMGDTIAKFDGARVIMDYLQVLSSTLSEERNGDGTRNLPLECIELLRKLLIHCTDNSVEFCRAVGTCGLLAMLVQDVTTFHNRAHTQSTWPMIRSILAIVYNCARTPENQEYFSFCGASDALKPYLRVKDVEIRITTLSCLGFIVDKDNLHLIRLNEDIAKIIVSMLVDTVDTPAHTTSVEGCQYSTLQMVTILTGLVQNDENKQVFVKHGVVDKLIQLMESGDEEEKECAILCIQKLAYNDHISTIMKETTRVEKVLITIKENRKLSSTIRDVASAALQILQEGPPRVDKDPSAGSGTISIIKYSDLEPGKVIGEGGFGQVRKAYHKNWMTDVAIKKLTCSSRDESVRRSKALIEEANFMKRVQNAYKFIVCLHGVCIEDEFTALVMEFMANGSVKDLMSRAKPVPWALRWRILHETILGMNFLHSMDPQIIHHDLKVQNVLLDGDFHAKIADFGLAEYKRLTSIGDEKGNLCGTITHIAPEYFKNPDLKAGEKFDVYSFGIFVWEVLTGNRPYQDIMGVFIAGHVMNGKRPDKKRIPTDGPNEVHFFVTLMEKCWDQDPKKRPKFKELGKEVQEVTKHTNAQVAHDIQLVLAKQGEAGPVD